MPTRCVVVPDRAQGIRFKAGAVASTVTWTREHTAIGEIREGVPEDEAKPGYLTHILWKMIFRLEEIMFAQCITESLAARLCGRVGYGALACGPLDLFAIILPIGTTQVESCAKWG